MANEAPRIGELLIEHGVITGEQLKEGLARQKTDGGRIVQILISLGYMTEEDLLRCLGGLSGISSIDIDKYTIAPELTQLVPREFALQHEVMPLDKLGRLLTVAMAVPLDVKTQVELEELTGLRIRSVLCSRSDVRSTVHRYYGAGPATPKAAEAAAPAPVEVEPNPESVRLKNVTAMLETIGEFPLLPQVHMHILERLSDEEVSVEELTELISQDPTLSANLLKVANSAAYAARSPFESVHRAIAYLGLRELNNIVTGTAVLQTLSAAVGADLTRTFERAYRCAFLTRLICLESARAELDVAFTAGLLHDIGTIVLRIFSAERLLQVEDEVAASGKLRVEVEEALLGVSCSELGFQLAQRWNIPEPLAEAIRFHDRLDHAPQASDVTVAVGLASLCLDNATDERGFERLADDPLAKSLMQRLQLDPDVFAGIAEHYSEGLPSMTLLSPGA